MVLSDVAAQKKGTYNLSDPVDNMDAYMKVRGSLDPLMK
jgi:hypothetical protein